MQKSGVPMADRPSLLLKGSGRVNRILGSEEDLTDVLAKSVRLLFSRLSRHIEESDERQLKTGIRCVAIADAGE